MSGTIQVEALETAKQVVKQQNISPALINGMTSMQPPPEAGLVNAFSEILLNKLKLSKADDAKRLSSLRHAIQSFTLSPVEFLENQLGLTVFNVNISALAKMMSSATQGLKQLLTMQG